MMSTGSQFAQALSGKKKTQNCSNFVCFLQKGWAELPGDCGRRGTRG